MNLSCGEKIVIASVILFLGLVCCGIYKSVSVKAHLTGLSISDCFFGDVTIVKVVKP